jgi:hypothetical protein
VKKHWWPHVLVLLVLWMLLLLLLLLLLKKLLWVRWGVRHHVRRRRPMLRHPVRVQHHAAGPPLSAATGAACYPLQGPAPARGAFVPKKEEPTGYGPSPYGHVPERERGRRGARRPRP